MSNEDDPMPMIAGICPNRGREFCNHGGHYYPCINPSEEKP